MPLLSFKDFSNVLCNQKGRILGCDIGEKTIGLASSDESYTIATSLTTIRRSQWKKDSVTLLKEIEAHQICGIIVGFPLNMNGTEGPRCQSTRQFVTNLLQVIDLPVCLWDERLSTLAVTRTLLEADVSRAKRKQVVDKMAACYILQGFLDAMKFNIRTMAQE
jgi:putative Holliday junction resolvase